MRVRYVALALVLWLTAVPRASADSTRGEVRAIWVTRWDYRTAADVRTIAARCAALGLNRVYFQVRGRADAFYRSALEPWGEEIGGSDPGFDPLAVAIEAARENGLELHAWINVLAGWKGTSPPRDRRHLLHTHPDWFLTDRDGLRHLLDEHYTMLNPCLTPVRRHIVRVAEDIARRYAIDGLHLDYIRFVFPDASRRAAVPWDPATLRLFEKESGGSPDERPEAWDRFRRRAVNTVVYRVSEAVRGARPGCRISAAVIRDLTRGKEVFLQDSPTWLGQGWIDEIVSMNYERDAAEFSSTTLRDLAHLDLVLPKPGVRPRDTLIPGIGAHLIHSPRELEDQIEATRAALAPGYALFAYASFYPTPSHASRSGAKADRLRGDLRQVLWRLNRGFTRSATPPADAPGASLSPAAARTPR